MAAPVDSTRLERMKIRHQKELQCMVNYFLHMDALKKKNEAQLAAKQKKEAEKQRKALEKAKEAERKRLEEEKLARLHEEAREEAEKHKARAVHAENLRKAKAEKEGQRASAKTQREQEEAKKLNQLEIEWKQRKALEIKAKEQQTRIQAFQQHEQRRQLAAKTARERKFCKSMQLKLETESRIQSVLARHRQTSVEQPPKDFYFEKTEREKEFLKKHQQTLYVTVIRENNRKNQRLRFRQKLEKLRDDIESKEKKAELNKQLHLEAIIETSKAKDVRRKQKLAKTFAKATEHQQYRESLREKMDQEAARVTTLKTEQANITAEIRRQRQLEIMEKATLKAYLHDLTLGKRISSAIPSRLSPLVERRVSTRQNS